MTVPQKVKLARHPIDLDDDGHEYVELGVTTETDTTLRLAPDGTGGVEWGTGGGFSGDAVDVNIADAGGYFTATEVENALQELASKDIGYLAHGNTGSTETFSSLIGWHSATQNANCTFTFSDAVTGLVAAMVLELTIDSGGPYTQTWPGGTVWASGSAPVLAASTTYILTFFSRNGGSTWYAFPTGGSTVAALDDLSDVTITSPAANDRLAYDGTVWRNSAAIWRPLMDGAGAVITDGGTGEAIMALS